MVALGSNLPGDGWGVTVCGTLGERKGSPKWVLDLRGGWVSSRSRFVKPRLSPDLEWEQWAEGQAPAQVSIDTAGGSGHLRAPCLP